MKKFKNCLLSLPRTGPTGFVIGLSIFHENTSERNVLVETNHGVNKELKKRTQHYISALN